MAKDRISEAKKLRKALQICMSAVELDEEDVEELGSALIDEFDPNEKYKKGMLCSFSGVTYICLKTTKRGETPDKDAEHWAVFGAATTEPEEPEQGGGEHGGSEPEPSVPEYDPDATYNKGDRCSLDGTTYECQKNNVRGIAPGSNDKYWAAV